MLSPRPLTGGGWLGVPTAAWVRVAVLVVAFCAIYQYNLRRLWDKTNFFNGDPNWYHAGCVPLIGLYFLMMRREDLAATPVRPLLAGNFSRARVVSSVAVAVAGLLFSFVLSRLVPQAEGFWIIRGLIENLGYGLIGLGVLALVLDWGLATLLGGLALSAYGIYPGMNDFVWDTGMVVTLFGVVLTLCGWATMRIAWFPIVFLLCAIPWPPLVYSQIASPLQNLAAQVSVAILNLVGVEAGFGGTKIFLPQFDATGIRLPDRILNVAEACAGLRSLMTFVTLSAMVAFLSSRPLWQKIVITAAAVPIAIACNVMRVAGQGLCDLYLGHEWSQDFAHQFAGMVMLMPAIFMIMAVCWVVDHVFIEEAEDPAAPATAAKGVA